MNKDPIIDAVIYKVPDFPRKGVLFYDITGLLLNPDVFEYCINKMVEYYRDYSIDAIASIETRGYLFSVPLANRLHLPLILIRKAGKLPRATFKKEYTLEYGKETIEVHKDDIVAKQSILLVDDVLATGGTTYAACELLAEGGAKVTAVFAVLGLTFLPFKQKLKGYDLKYFVEYQSGEE